MLIALGGRRAEDGWGGAALAGHLQQLSLDVVDRLGKVEEKVGLIRVLPVIHNLERELQSLVTSDRVLVEISMRRKMVGLEKNVCGDCTPLNFHEEFYLLWIILRSGMQMLSSPQSFWMLTVSLDTKAPSSRPWSWDPSTGERLARSPSSSRSSGS